MASKHTQAWYIEEGEYDKQADLSAKIAFLVRYAVLAPSPWNSQPWKFKIKGNRLEMYEVPERFQEGRDAEGRERNVGCGAALANLIIAAKHFGLNATMQLTPSKAPEHCISVVSFSEPDPEAPVPDEDEEDIAERELDERLFQAITKRHSFRLDFLEKPIDNALCQKMIELADNFGISFVPILSDSTKLALAGMVSEGDRQLEAVKDARADSALTTDSTALCAVFMSEDDDCGGWLNCGVAIQNVLLLAASYGIQASFLSQIIAIPELRTRLSELLGRKDVPQTVIRLGFPSQEEIKPTPRLSLEDVLIS